MQKIRQSLFLSLLCMSLPIYTDETAAIDWFESLFKTSEPSTKTPIATKAAPEEDVPIASLFAPEEPPKPCDDSCRSMRITARHIENKGIGYPTGYTTLEGFFAPRPDVSRLMPFIDLRGHVFNNGRWAANGGIGLRTLVSDRVYGAYAYYDYRNTQHKDFNQVSFGLESLGTSWDFRANGYVVMGNRRSHPFNLQFYKFSGNNVLYKEKFAYALSGGNAEVGYHYNKVKHFDFYGALGPYYLIGPVGSGVWGGEGRAKATYKKWLGLEASYSYDHKFKNIVQGQLFINFTFGPKGKATKREGRSCSDSYQLCERMVQPIMKNEIIPVSTKTQKNLAIDPLTGKPYTLWFVNNLSHSLGTYESPFSTLADAEKASNPHEIIYIFPGDLMGTGLASGITLKDGQQLLGATMDQTLRTSRGTITLPAQASGSVLPLITNPSGDVVILANDNLISGLFIQNNNGHGIRGTGINNAIITQNFIESNSTTYSGLELQNSGGIINCFDNSISIQNYCVNINNTSPVSNAQYLFANNILYSNDGGSGVNINFVNGENNYFRSDQNQILGSDTAAITIVCDNATPGAPHTFDVLNSSLFVYDTYVVTLNLNNSSACNLNINNSALNGYYGVEINANNASICNAKVANNVFNFYQYAYVANTTDTSKTNMEFNNNSLIGYYYAIYLNTSKNSVHSGTINGNTHNGYEYFYYLDSYDNSVISGQIENNTINTSSGYGFYLDMANSSTFAANIVNNTINTAYDHIDVNQVNDSSYTGSITGNTFKGQFLDNMIDWVLSQQASANTTIANNTLNGCASAISLRDSSTAPSIFRIVNNNMNHQYTNCIAVTNNNSPLLGVAIAGNIFSGWGTNAVNIQAPTLSPAGTTWLEIDNNTSNPLPNAFLINQAGSTSVVNMMKPQGDIGQFNITGTVTEVTTLPW